MPAPRVVVAHGLSCVCLKHPCVLLRACGMYCRHSVRPQRVGHACPQPLVCALHVLLHSLGFQVGADGQYETLTMFSCLESVGVLEVVRNATHLVAPCCSATHRVVPICTYWCAGPRAAGYCDVETVDAYTQLHKRLCPRLPGIDHLLCRTWPRPGGCRVCIRPSVPRSGPQYT